MIVPAKMKMVMVKGEGERGKRKKEEEKKKKIVNCYSVNDENQKNIREIKIKKKNYLTSSPLVSLSS